MIFLMRLLYLMRLYYLDVHPLQHILTLHPSISATRNNPPSSYLCSHFRTLVLLCWPYGWWQCTVCCSLFSYKEPSCLNYGKLSMRILLGMGRKMMKMRLICLTGMTSKAPLTMPIWWINVSPVTPSDSNFSITIVLGWSINYRRCWHRGRWEDQDPIWSIN